jgi:hypothetical protein
MKNLLPLGSFESSAMKSYEASNSKLFGATKVMARTPLLPLEDALSSSSQPPVQQESSRAQPHVLLAVAPHDHEHEEVEPRQELRADALAQRLRRAFHA